MREVTFVLQRQDKWKEFEGDLSATGVADPDRLAELYVDVTDDLAYASAQYPGTSTVVYLNQLAARAHALIYKNRSVGTKRFLQFWVDDVPRAMIELRSSILVSAAVFVFCAVLSFLACTANEDVLSAVMGNSYVEMTKENIRNGRPFDVYAKYDGFGMFLMIAANNLWVTVIFVAIGVVPIFGPAMMMLRNAFMVGAFHALFARYNIVGDFVLAVYLHGAFELSAIVVAGGASLAIGNGMLFPGTYTRVEAFRRAVSAAMKVLCAMVPFIICAALLESFVTRFYGMPLYASIPVVACTFVAIWWYVLVLPKQLVVRMGQAEAPVRTA